MDINHIFGILNLSSEKYIDVSSFVDINVTENYNVNHRCVLPEPGSGLLGSRDIYNFVHLAVYVFLMSLDVYVYDGLIMSIKIYFYIRRTYRVHKIIFIYTTDLSCP